MSDPPFSSPGRAGHMWEKWDGETKRRMAEELTYHGVARAEWLRRYVNMEVEE